MPSPSSTAVCLYQPVHSQKPVASTLVVVDSFVQDLSPVVQALDTSAILMRLNPHYNGIEQITARLVQCPAVKRLHLLVQGRPGAMRLGSLWLTHAGLETHQELLQRWQQTFVPQAEIHLHSPNVVMGLEGMEFVGRLSQLTGAVVVASNLSIGHAAVQPLHSLEVLPLAS